MIMIMMIKNYDDDGNDDDGNDDDNYKDENKMMMMSVA